MLKNGKGKVKTVRTDLHFPKAVLNLITAETGGGAYETDTSGGIFGFCGEHARVLRFLLLIPS